MYIVYLVYTCVYIYTCIYQVDQFSSHSLIIEKWITVLRKQHYLMIAAIKSTIQLGLLKRRKPKCPLKISYSSCVCVCVCAQSCLTLCDSMDCSLTGSSVRGIFQVRILEWVAISYSRGYSWPRDQTCVPCVSCIGRRICYHCDTLEATHSS